MPLMMMLMIMMRRLQIKDLTVPKNARMNKHVARQKVCIDYF